jgi:hypothetical protein
MIIEAPMGQHKEKQAFSSALDRFPAEMACRSRWVNSGCAGLAGRLGWSWHHSREHN